MTDLLIHSMSEFASIILECLEAAEVKNIVEIGSEYGGMSTKLAQFTAAQCGRLTTVDPAPKQNFIDWQVTQTNVYHLASTSLTAIGSITNAEAWLLDGDHNWYTVYNELVQINALHCRDRTPMLVFLHDVGWPWGRRDLYYAPERIPAPYLHPHVYDSGVIFGSDDLVKGRGFRGNGSFALAQNYGGARNGVLTAVEDFIASARVNGKHFTWMNIPGVFGLGALFDQDALWCQALEKIITPFHNNKLLQSLEENRLKNYIEVIEWQDRMANRDTAGSFSL